MSIKMSEKKFKNKQRSDHFLEDKMKWSMILPRFFFFGVGVIGMEIQKKQTEEKEGNLTKK